MGFGGPFGPFGSPGRSGPFMPTDPVIPQKKILGDASQESPINSPTPHGMKDRINNRMGPGAGQDRIQRFQRMQPGMGGFPQMQSNPGLAPFNPMGGGAIPPALQNQLPSQPPPPTLGLQNQNLLNQFQRPISLGMGGFGQRMY